MMRDTLLALLMLVAAPLHAQENRPTLYDETINPMEQIDHALEQAQAQGHHVICQVGGNWCPWCLRLADFITRDSTIHQTIADNYEYIHVNYNPRNRAQLQQETTQQMMRRLGNPARFGFPVLVVLDAEGRLLHIQDSSFLEEGKSYNAERVLRFLRSWTPEALKP